MVAVLVWIVWVLEMGTRTAQGLTRTSKSLVTTPADPEEITKGAAEGRPTRAN